MGEWGVGCGVWRSIEHYVKNVCCHTIVFVCTVVEIFWRLLCTVLYVLRYLCS